jgi:hypothetical protein
MRHEEGCVSAAVRGRWRIADGGLAGAGILAFNIRAGMNLFLLLFRIRRIPRCVLEMSRKDTLLMYADREKRFAMIRHALLGPDSVRFGAMLGASLSSYTSAPFLTPGRHVRLDL